MVRCSCPGILTQAPSLNSTPRWGRLRLPVSSRITAPRYRVHNHRMLAPSLSISIALPLAPTVAFDALIRELRSALARWQMDFEPGPAGRLVERDFVVGNVVAWERGRRVALRWRPASWNPEEMIRVELRVDPSEEGSARTVEHRGWGPLVGDAEEPTGWFAGEVLAPVMHATAPV